VTLGRLDQRLQPAEAGMDLLEQLAVGECGAGALARAGRMLTTNPSRTFLRHGADSRLRSALMEVRLAGGVMVDLASRDDLEGGFDRLAKVLERPHGRYQRLFGGRPPRAGNLPFVVQLQPSRPPGGMMWVLEYVIVMGDDPTVSTAIANVRAALLAGNIPPDASLGGNAPITGADFGGVIQSGIVVPSTITLPDKAIVYSNEDLYAVIGGTGTIAGAANYRVVIGCLELPQTAAALLW
jgi:hypothetical protein